MCGGSNSNIGVKYCQSGSEAGAGRLVSVTETSLSTASAGTLRETDPKSKIPPAREIVWTVLACDSLRHPFSLQDVIVHNVTIAIMNLSTFHLSSFPFITTTIAWSRQAAMVITAGPITLATRRDLPHLTLRRSSEVTQVDGTT
jgi:hypothetical protein